MPIANRALAEFIGTFWLVLGGCGSAVLAAAFPNLGIGFLGVAFAFGLTVLTMAYGIGHISGCHLNPAVTVGLVVGRRFKAADALPYIVAQVLGAVVGRPGALLHRERQGRLQPRAAAWRRTGTPSTRRAAIRWARASSAKSS